MKPTLLLLAAGMESRYGGLKQLDGLGPNGELNSNMAQQVLKEVDGSFKSFFGLLKLSKNGQYDNKKIK